jgi:Ni/Co efflux regulator RcnB
LIDRKARGPSRGKVAHDPASGDVGRKDADMTQKPFALISGARRPLATLLAAAGLVLAIPAVAAAQEHGPTGGPPHGGPGGGAPHGMGGHGGGHPGPSVVGGHGGPHPGGPGPVGPGGVYHGYDGVLQHDEHGNAGDRRNFGMNLRSGQRFHGGGYHRPPGWYAHGWGVGEILPPLFWAQEFWLTDYWLFDLSPPPYGYVWVRDGDDALLIDRQTGAIVEVIDGVFY